VLGRESLHIKKALIIDPWACVEGIQNAKFFSLYIYHSYGENFDMKNDCHIGVCDAAIMGETIDRSKF